MNTIISWIISNKEWIFSGIGIAVISVVIGFIKRKENKSQNQEVGDNSIGIQASGDITIPASILRRNSNGKTKSKNRRK